MRLILALLCCAPLLGSANDAVTTTISISANTGTDTSAQQRPRIAIIIDDLGYHRKRGEAIVDLPGDITCAIIPETPYGPRLAKRAERAEKEVMIHLPMETASTRPLDKGGIKDEMTHSKLVTTVRQAFLRIPQAQGLNNHMGSILTAEEEPMQWLMQELALNHYFFIDSRTTPDTVAEKVAIQNGLHSAGRDVFLDNERNLNSINTQFNQLLRVAKRRGHAIAIGHPYPETIAYLQGVLPLLEHAGIELVSASELLNPPPMMTAQQAQANHISETP